jgi:hypothetical protein
MAIIFYKHQETQLEADTPKEDENTREKTIFAKCGGNDGSSDHSE